MVKNRWKTFLLLGLAVLCAPLQASQDSQYLFISRPIYLPITLPSLVRGSDRIFVGRVESMETVATTRAYVKLTLRVEIALKGGDRLRPLMELRQSKSLASTVAPGDQVVWFLPADGPEGFSVPLGFLSGDFRVDQGQDTVQSLNGNRDLWSDEGELWEFGECSRSRFLTILENWRTRGKTLLEYLRRADQPYYPSPLPMPFLKAAVLSCITDGEYETFLKTHPNSALPWFNPSFTREF